MKKLLFTIALLLCSPILLQAQAPERIAGRVAQHWLELHNDFQSESDVWGNYTLDLTLEALLHLDRHTESRVYTETVLEVFRKRNISPGDTISYTTQPFCSINFTLGEIEKDKAWHSGFIAESYRMYEAAQYAPEGGVLINHKGDYRLLVDYLQEYASRLAKTGYLTSDTVLFSACVDQFLIYETILRHDSTGLWRQGRGWCSDTTLLSQGTWSRGHGWLLRGLVTSMLYLPEAYRVKLLPVLERVSYALLNVQREDGMYPILLSRSPDQSAPDVSGTGMIAYYMAVALKEGWLHSNDFKPSIQKATRALRAYISDKGEILSSSKGPGPLCHEDEYINYVPEVDEKHGFQGAIYGMIAEMLLNE